MTLSSGNAEHDLRAWIAETVTGWANNSFPDGMIGLLAEKPAVAQRVTDRLENYVRTGRWVKETGDDAPDYLAAARDVTQEPERVNPLADPPRPDRVVIGRVIDISQRYSLD